MPLIAGASLHHGLPSLCKENDGEGCSNNMNRRKTRTLEDAEPDIGSTKPLRPDLPSPEGERPVRNAPVNICPAGSRPEGRYAARRSPLRGSWTGRLGPRHLARTRMGRGE
jgi:hypothetical protein